MERTRLAPTVGIVACLLLVAMLVVPYLLIRTPRIAATYYGSGPINPLFAGLWAVVALLAFAAGRQGRTDPVLAAATALAFGVFALAFCVLWLLSNPQDVILGLDLSPDSPTGESQFVRNLQYHPPLLSLVAFVVPASAGWYAYELGLV